MSLLVEQVERPHRRVNDFTLMLSLDRYVKRLREEDPHPYDVMRFGETGWKTAYQHLVAEYLTELRRRGHNVVIVAK